MLKKESFDSPRDMVMLFTIMMYFLKIKCVSRNNISEDSNLGLFRDKGTKRIENKPVQKAYALWGKHLEINVFGQEYKTVSELKEFLLYFQIHWIYVFWSLKNFLHASFDFKGWTHRPTCRSWRPSSWVPSPQQGQLPDGQQRFVWPHWPASWEALDIGQLRVLFPFLQSRNISTDTQCEYYSLLQMYNF